MKSTMVKKTLLIAAVMVVLGAAVAFAHGGFGRGGHMMGPGYDGHMMGRGMMGGYGGHMMGGHGGSMMGYGGYDDLSEKERAELDEVRDKFFDETRALRNQIDDKRYDLRKEMVKENPDTAKVTQLQKELSQLESEFDQKALQHQLQVRKILPAKARGYGRGFGPGYCW